MTPRLHRTHRGLKPYDAVDRASTARAASYAKARNTSVRGPEHLDEESHGDPLTNTRQVKSTEAPQSTRSRIGVVSRGREHTRSADAGPA